MVVLAFLVKEEMQQEEEAKAEEGDLVLEEKLTRGVEEVAGSLHSIRPQPHTPLLLSLVRIP